MRGEAPDLSNEPERQPSGQGRATMLAAAAFVPALIFLLIPNRLLLRNLGHMTYSPRLVVLCTSAFAIVWVAGWPVFASMYRRRWCAAVVRVWLFLGLVLLLCCALAPELLTGRLTGFWTIALVEALLVAGAAWVVLRADMRTLLVVTATMAACLVATTVATHLLAYRVVDRTAQMRNARRVAFQKRQAAAGGRTTGALPGNVYHVLLDGFQAEAYEVLRARDPALELPGFTLYPDFAGYYWLTTFNLAGLLQGRLIRQGESVSQFAEDAWLGGLWQTLGEAGINVRLYPYYETHCTPYAEPCVSATKTSWRMRGGSVTGHLTGAGETRVWSPIDIFLTFDEQWLLDRSVFLLLPRTVQLLAARAPDGKAVPLGNRHRLLDIQTVPLTDWLWPRPPGTHLDTSLTSQQMVFMSVLNFENMLRTEARWPGRGQYIFAHVNCPHGPYLYNADCQVADKQRPMEARAYLNQARCALHLVSKLTYALRELDRFDDALIIVHGDHGAHPAVAAQLVQHAPAYFALRPDSPRIGAMARIREKASGDWWRLARWRNGEAVALRRHPLLLVKYPGAREFSVAAEPATMLQLAPTMARHAGLSTAGYAEPPLGRAGEPGARASRFFLFDGVGHMPHTHKMARRTEPPPVFRVFARGPDGWRERAPLPVEY